MKILTLATLLSLFLLPSISTLSQQLELLRVEFNERKVIIHYNLSDTVAGRFYVVRAFSSVDNYLNPLVSTSGDVGIEVTPGLNKKIIWDPFPDLGASFNGKVAIKVRARVFIPFVKFDAFEEYKHITRGRPYNITWSGGTAQNILNFDLYRGEKKIASFPNIANSGHYKITFPTSIRPGRDYRIKISDSKNKDEVVYTGYFRMKRRIPLAVKISALALISGVTFFLLPEEPFALPGPPDISKPQNHR